jgi:DNA (cytosine-5)-methyltransferase 1
MLVKKALSDIRGLLFNNILEIVKYHLPKYCILENVKHIKKVSNGDVYKYIKTSLEKLNYTVVDIEINPCDLGIPQNRPRILFLTVRNDLLNDVFNFKEKIQYIF